MSDLATSTDTASIEPVAIESATDITAESTPVAESTEKVDADEETKDEAPVVETPPPSINDENAFPALGGGLSTAAATPVSWGPAMKSVAPSTNGSAKTKSTTRSTVQEVFEIQPEAAEQLAKPDFIKIVAEIKKNYSVSIESQISSINKIRTFVVSGKPADTIRAKREILRRLTKKVKQTFQIPAKTRSAIIGAQGRNLKPIIDATGAKVDIARNSTPSSDSDEEDLLEVTLEGDADGCVAAKKMIMAIVDEESKTLATKVTVPVELRAFYNTEEINTDNLKVSKPNQNGAIAISGLREDVVAKKAEIQAQLESLSSKIITQTHSIDKAKHDFVNKEMALSEFNVLIKIPNPKTHDDVFFTGLPENIKAAIKRVKTDVDSYFNSDLGIFKSHNNNVPHARVLASYFDHAGILKDIGTANDLIVRAPPYNILADDTFTAISIRISALKSQTDAVTKARQDIVAKVMSLPPSRVLVVSDVSAYFAKRVSSATETAAKEQNVHVVPFSKLTNGASDKIFLIALDQDGDEFGPSQDEVDARLNAVNASLDTLRTAQANLKSVTLDVPSEKQQFIEGPKGTTLKRMLASHDNASIKLHFNGQTEEADKVFIQGDKASVGKIQSEIDELLTDAADQKDIYSFVSETQVPVVALSRLIGKSGANLNVLRDQFSVEIDVERNPAGEKATLKITGYKYNVKEAEQEIIQISKRLADEITHTLIVPKKYRPSMIGASGKHVKKLESKYNVRINFSSGSDEVTIRGPTRGANKAQQELQELLDFEIENGHTKEISVPQSAISRVIGRSGETINRIIVDAGIDITVKGDDKDAETRTITMTGSRKGLTEAEKQIMAIVKEVEDTVTVELEVDPKYFRDILGPKGSTKQQIIDAAGDAEDKDYRKLLQIPEAGSGSNKITFTGPKKIVDKIVAQVKKIISEKENAVSEKLEIAKEKHRLIIGTSGLIRRSIEDDFKVSVNIPRADDKSETITLVGLAENVEKAKAKITELTVDDWKSVVEVPSHLHAAVSEKGAFPRRVFLENNVEITHGFATNKAHKLNNKLPTPPAEASGSDDETVKVTIVKDESAEKSSETIPWRLKGDDEEVAKVEQQIKEAIKLFSNDDRSGFVWVKDSSVFRKIIGPQGSRLINLRKKAGAQIYVPKTSDKNKDIIVLRGNEQSLEKAVKLLRAEIEKK